MKNIVIPIDFSQPSLSSLQYGLAIGAHYDSNIFLLHVYGSYEGSTTIKNMDRILKSEYYTEMQRMLEKVDVPLNVEIYPKVVQGNAVSKVVRISKNINADLIVVAAKGPEDDTDLYLGATAGGLVKQAQSPLMIIPEAYDFKPIEDVVIAVKSMKCTPQLNLDPLRSVIQKFHANLDLLHVQMPSTEDVQYGDLSLVDHLNMKVRQLHQAEAGSIYEGVTEYLKMHQTDLICVIRRKRGFFERMFSTSTTKKEFSSDRPLLVLHGHREEGDV